MNVQNLKIVNSMVEAKFSEFLIKLNINEVTLEHLSIDEDYNTIKMMTCFEIMQNVDSLSLLDINKIITLAINEFYMNYLIDHIKLANLSSNRVEMKGLGDSSIRICTGGHIYDVSVG